MTGKTFPGKTDRIIYNPLSCYDLAMEGVNLPTIHTRPASVHTARPNFPTDERGRFNAFDQNVRPWNS